MRLTFATQYREALANMTDNKERLDRFTREVSSGRRLNAASDDPSAAGAAVSEHAELTTLNQYERATDSTSARLTVVDSALDDILTQLTAAKTQATSARNSFTTASTRAAAVLSIQSLKETIVSDLATSFRGVYLFSGTETTTAPYTKSGPAVSAYQGDHASASVDVDRQFAVPISFDGESITKGSDPNDIFQELDALITAVQNGDAAGIDAGLDAIDRAFSRTVQLQTTVGTSLHRLEDQSTRLSSIKQTVQSRLAALEDTDLAAAINGLQEAQTAQQATLAATATINRQNLMDYLR